MVNLPHLYPRSFSLRKMSLSTDLDRLRDRLCAFASVDKAPPTTLLTLDQMARMNRLTRIHSWAERTFLPEARAVEENYLQSRSLLGGGTVDSGESGSEEDDWYDPNRKFSIVDFHSALEQTPSEASMTPSSASSSSISLEPWSPPLVALSSDPGSAWDRTKTVPLLTKEIFTPPVSVEASLDDQSWKCAGCNAEWEFEALMARAVGGVISLSDSVRFCYYTGALYCQKCHDGRLKQVIPARCAQRWDFTPRDVCREAAQFLEFHFDEPIICISAVNPKLYDVISILQKARRLRQQLLILHTTCVACPAFRRRFYSFSGSKSAIVPEHRRYLVEDTEFWSLADLTALHSSQPDLQAPPTEERCPVILELVSLRDAMVRHVVRSCRDMCQGLARKQCPRCRRDDALYEFDVNNVSTCSKCKSVFHKPCWQLSGCTVCAERLRSRTQ